MRIYTLVIDIYIYMAHFLECGVRGLKEFISNQMNITLAGICIISNCINVCVYVFTYMYKYLLLKNHFAL